MLDKPTIPACYLRQPFHMRGAFLLSLFVALLQQCSRSSRTTSAQRDIYLDVERNAACRNARIHSGMKPLIGAAPTSRT